MNAMGHVSLNCIDKPRQEAFYVKHFGFRRARVFKPGRPDEFVILRLGSMCIELFQNPQTPAGEGGGPQCVGFRHIAFEVESLEEKIAELQADGVETGEIEDCTHMSEGLRICFFTDPEGNVLEIMEGWTDEKDLSGG